MVKENVNKSGIQLNDNSIIIRSPFRIACATYCQSINIPVIKFAVSSIVHKHATDCSVKLHFVLCLNFIYNYCLFLTTW